MQHGNRKQPMMQETGFIRQHNQVVIILLLSPKQKCIRRPWLKQIIPAWYASRTIFQPTPMIGYNAATNATHIYHDIRPWCGRQCSGRNRFHTGFCVHKSTPCKVEFLIGTKWIDRDGDLVRVGTIILSFRRPKPMIIFCDMYSLNLSVSIISRNYFRDDGSTKGV